MNARENYLKTVRFERPDYIPMTFHVNDSCWQHYPQEFLFEEMEKHKLLFPGFVPPKGKYVPEFSKVANSKQPYPDDFGCVWETLTDGITGTVTKHPLFSWEAYESYQMPDPSRCMGIGEVDWAAAETWYKQLKTDGHLTMGGLRHGHTFLQLCDLRGYENLTFDFVDEEPRLLKLITELEAFNAYIVDKYISFGVDVMSYPEDLGMQTGPMLSPAHFKQYIKPSYQRLMKPSRDKGIITHMHSDGDIRDLADDLIDGGVQIINLQDLVNGIDWIAGKFAGKTCIELDIDRQSVTPCGTPAQIDALIKEEVTKLSTKQGGLMMIYGLYPCLPLENVSAVMDAMERYALYY